jgi:hypothetical protein
LIVAASILPKVRVKLASQLSIRDLNVLQRRTDRYSQDGAPVDFVAGRRSPIGPSCEDLVGIESQALD